MKATVKILIGIFGEICLQTLKVRKKLLLILFVLGFVVQGWGQAKETEIIVNGNYFLNQTVSDDQLSLVASSIFAQKKENLKGKHYKLTVTSLDNDKVSFRFWRFSEKSELNKLINGDEKDVATIYTLSTEDFKKLVAPLYDKSEWRAGFYTIPYKLRFKDFDFDANVNLGMNIGWKFRWNRRLENGFALEPILGIGLSSIKMDESNSLATSATNISAFTVNTGLLFHVTSDINLGLTIGWDNISGNDQKRYDWKHNDKAWLGIGINVSFSKEAKNTGKVGSN